MLKILILLDLQMHIMAESSYEALDVQVANL
jgi:hypothetical protein